MASDNIFIKVDGKTFRCLCGCNVFRREDSKEPRIYICNGCGAAYLGQQ